MTAASVCFDFGDSLSYYVTSKVEPSDTADLLLATLLVKDVWRMSKAITAWHGLGLAIPAFEGGAYV